MMSFPLPLKSLAIAISYTAVIALPLPAASAVLFELLVDPNPGTPFSDATGRHSVIGDGLPAGAAGLPPGGGSVVPTSVLTPEGSAAALMTGGWLEILSTPATAEDFLFPESQDLTIELWFKSGGNGSYDDGTSNPGRVHAIGFGDLTNNLDVDLGDSDPAPGILQETAVWTYFGSQGSNAVVDMDLAHDRNHYLDDNWHKYALVRRGSDVTVYVDGVSVGTTSFTDPLGSSSMSTRNYIGRASLLTDAVVAGDGGIYPWFGYIGGVRVFDVAISPSPTVPVLHPIAIVALGAVVWSIGALGLRGGSGGRNRIKRAQRV